VINHIRSANTNLKIQTRVTRKTIRRRKTKIKITKQDPESDDEFAHVFMFRGDDDDIILDDPYWTQPSSPSNSSDSNDIHPDVAYFPYSSAPPSPSTLKSENDEWKIEYQRAIKKLRTDHPEL